VKMWKGASSCLVCGAQRQTDEVRLVQRSERVRSDWLRTKWLSLPAVLNDDAKGMLIQAVHELELQFDLHHANNRLHRY